MVGAIGLDNILAYVGPLLDSLSPALIILILFYVFVPKVNDKRCLFAARCTMYASFVYGILDAIYAYNSLCGWNLNTFESLYLKMPLANMKLSWVVGCAIVALLSYVFYQLDKKQVIKNVKVSE